MCVLDPTHSDLRRLFQPSIIKVFKNKLCLSATVQGEGMVNPPFPAGSTAESQQIQLFPHCQKEVKKTSQLPVSFLPHNEYQTFLHVMISVARKEDCFWLYVLQRVHRNYLISEIMGPSWSIFFDNFRSASSISSFFAFSSFNCGICLNTVEA